MNLIAAQLPTPEISSPDNNSSSSSAPTINVTDNVYVSWKSSGVSGTTYYYKVIENGTSNTLSESSFTYTAIQTAE